MHFDGKHAKLKWDDYKDKCANLQAMHGGTTQGVAVRGTGNKGKLKEKKKAQK